MTLRQLRVRLLLLRGHLLEHLALLPGHLREHLRSGHLAADTAVRGRLRLRLRLLHLRRHLLRRRAHHSLVVSILEAHDLLPRARQLLLELGNLRGGGSLRLAAGESRGGGGDGSSRRRAVVGLRLLLLRRVGRGGLPHVRHETVDASPAALQPLERLRETLLELLVRSLELLDGARADADGRVVTHRRGAVAVARGRTVVPHQILLEHGVVAEAKGVGVLLEHGELPGGEAEPRGVFALPLGAVA